MRSFTYRIMVILIFCLILNTNQNYSTRIAVVFRYDSTNSAPAVSDFVNKLSDGWSQHTNFGGFLNMSVKVNNKANHIYIDQDCPQMLVNFDSPVGTQFPITIPSCNDGYVRIAKKNLQVQTPAGTFQHVIKIDFVQPPTSCYDIGVLSQYHAKGIGIVKYVTQSISGPQTYLLKGGIINGKKYPEWKVPVCKSITGIPIFNYCRFPDPTFAENSTLPQAYRSGVRAIAALKKPNHLLAEYERTIYHSSDAGCTWRVLGQVPGNFTTVTEMVPAGLTDVYAYNEIGSIRDRIYYIDADLYLIQRRGYLPKDSRYDNRSQEIIELWVDPANIEHLRLVTKCGTIYDSFDGGYTFEQTGNRLNEGIYDASIETTNPDHIIVGALHSGIWYSFDGGQTWLRASGLAPAEIDVNVFYVNQSHLDSDIVYAMGLRMYNDKSSEHFIYRSNNGGKSFHVALDGNDGPVLTNGTELFLHPYDPDRVYFSWGYLIWGQHNTWIYELNCKNHQIRTLEKPEYCGVWEIRFNPADPEILYLGLDKIFF